MTLISSCVAIIILSISYLFGTSIANKFFSNNYQVPRTAIGFFLLLGIFQFFSFLIIYLKLDSVILMISLIGIFLMSLIVVIKNRQLEYFSKKEMQYLLFCIIFTLILFAMMSLQTQGEKAFDSVHYTSMVIENSASSKIGGFSAFSGIIGNDINVQYDYQSFYHFFSMIIKLVRNVFSIENISLTPIYLNVSAIMYFFILSELLFKSLTYLKNKNISKLGLLSIFFWTLLFFMNYFNISLNFFGNTWKTLVIATIMLSIYQFINSKDYKKIYILTFLFSALIACSSSGFFIAAFIAISFFFYLIFKNYKDYRTYFSFAVSCLPIAIFTFLYIESISMLVATMIFIIYIILILFALLSKKLNDKQWDILLKLLRISFYCIVLFFIIISYFVSNTMFPGVDAHFSGYDFFFRINSVGDMTLNYFQSINFSEMIRNIIFWVMILVFIVKIEYEREYKLLLLLIVLLFLNPFVTPFVAKYMTYMVYSRSFEIIVNPFILTIIAGSIFSVVVGKKINYFFSIILTLVSIYLIYQITTNYYSTYLIPTSDYNSEYRITNNEYELYNEVIQEVNESPFERPKILSQNIGLKGYIPRIEVLLDANQYRSAPAYSDLNVDAPSEWMNIFYPRDFYGQKVWNEEPDFKNTCNAVYESKADYLVIDKAITYQEDELYLPFTFKVRECSTKIFENNDWAFYKVNK